MQTDMRLGELFSLWLLRRQSGEGVSPEVLCSSCPELLQELRGQVNAHLIMEHLRGPVEGTPTGAIARESEQTLYPSGASRKEMLPGSLLAPTPDEVAFLEPARADGELGSLGNYCVLGLLGRGGMGLVFLARDEALKRHVAVKVMRPQLAADVQARQRFLREAQGVAQLEHDRVVQIHHVGEAGGVPFLVMPLLRGEPLDRRLERQGKPTLVEAQRFGKQMAEGLAAAHAVGLVHRDIKPANVWLKEPDAQVVLLDFGLARPWSQAGETMLTQNGQVLGTPGYMAPEQAAGAPLDSRADLFSLGCVLYELITGRRPFNGSSVMAILRSLAVDEPPTPKSLDPTVPPALSDLIVRLLAKDPTRRPGSAAEVAAALAAPASPAPAALATEILPPVRPPRRRWAGVAGVALALALVGSLVWWAMNPPPETTGFKKTENLVASPVLPPIKPKTRYVGSIHVFIERTVEAGKPPRLLRLDDPRVLPTRPMDKFRVEAKVEPAAYLYLVWVEPGKNVIPVYPWNPAAEDNWRTRPAIEEPVTRVSLPPNAQRYEVEEPKVGVATFVLLARPTPLDVPDDMVRGWFEALPDLPLPPGGERGMVWFDDFVPVTGDPDRVGKFRIVNSEDPFAVWQGQLQREVGGRAAFQTAISFARTDGK